MAWFGLALLFGALILLRVTGFEEALRDTLRAGLRSDGSYEGRRFVQGVVVSVVLSIGLAGAFWWLWRATRTIRGHREIAVMVALASGCAMAFLILLRLISLHAIDRVLYGPLKLNWIGDLGASALILGASLYYALRVRANP